MSFSKTVYIALSNQKISVAQLSTMTGLSIPYIYGLLKGKRRWNEMVMKKVSNVLGIEIDYSVSAQIQNDQIQNDQIQNEQF